MFKTGDFTCSEHVLQVVTHGVLRVYRYWIERVPRDHSRASPVGSRHTDRGRTRSEVCIYYRAPEWIHGGAISGDACSQVMDMGFIAAPAVHTDRATETTSQSAT